MNVGRKSERTVTVRKFLASALLVVAVSAGAAFAAYFHIMLPASNILLSDENARAYWMSEKRVLLVWCDEVFIIYPMAGWVGLPSDYRNRLSERDIWPRSSTLVLWPRGSYASVPIDDAVKSNRGDRYTFRGNKLEIRSYFSPHQTSPYELTVEFPRGFIPPNQSLQRTRGAAAPLAVELQR